MFDALKEQPQDKILALIGQFRADPRAEKIDLGVGVYKDANGHTPIMKAVHEASARLLASETTKTYTALAGEAGYTDALTRMILGEGFSDRLTSISTPGGTGAIRQAAELIRMARPDATVWLSNPTWPNHPSIFRFVGLKMAEYRYFDAQSCDVDFDAMMQDLAQVKAGDVVLLHGCCHNPTGANLSVAQWIELARLLQSRGALPFIDLAYQGFGDGLLADAAATRLIAAEFEHVLIAASCSKNFGIYRERAGLLIALTAPKGKAVLQGNLNFLNRQNYSFPPDHGARLVSTILGDAALTQMWQTELEDMRLHMLTLRKELAAELRRSTNSARFDFIAAHRGMFSRLGLTPSQVETLREKHAIYMVGDSRMNIAGLNMRNTPILADAIADALR